MAFAVLSLGATGCGKETVARYVHDQLVKQMGAPDDIAVTIPQGSDAELRRGFIREMDIDGSHFKGFGGLGVDELKVRLADVQADVAKRTFKSAARAEVLMRLTDRDVQSYLRRRNKDLSTARLLFLKDKALISVDDFGMLHQPIRSSGTVEMTKDSKLVYMPKESFMGDHLMDDVTVGMLVDVFNPLVDLAKWPVTLRIDKIQYAPGAVEVHATLLNIKAGGWPKELSALLSQ
jgi:hypothetical protein